MGFRFLIHDAGFKSVFCIKMQEERKREKMKKQPAVTPIRWLLLHLKNAFLD